MSLVSAAPEFLASAATDLTGIGSSLSAAHAAAALPTTAVVAAAGDEVSAAIAEVFSAHGTGFQALSAQAAKFHTLFSSLLNGAAGSYLDTELANAADMIGFHGLDNLSISVRGRTLFETGSARAYSSVAPSSLATAIAIGPNSEAHADLDFGLNYAVAQGDHAKATATLAPDHQRFYIESSAFALGDYNTATSNSKFMCIAAAGGDHNTAIADGTQDSAFIRGGSGNTAIARANHTPGLAEIQGNTHHGLGILANDLRPTVIVPP